MKVHVVLDKNARQDAQARKAAFDALVRHGLVGLNQKRFERYGVASGEISPDLMDSLRRVPGVKAVEPDEQRRAI